MSERSSATPGAIAAELSSDLDTDIRAVLPTIQVPTLVMVDTEQAASDLARGVERWHDDRRDAHVP